MLIAIEGMDGVGKTTVAKELAKRNNYKYVDSGIHQLFGVDEKDSSYYQKFKSKEDEIFYKSNNDILTAWLSSLGNIYTATQMKEENIIIDRHILSNFQQNGTRETVGIYQILVKLIGVPDMSIILKASPEVRLERIRTRNKNDKDLKNERIAIDEYEKMIEFARKINMPHIIVDTENKTIEKIISEIEGKINIKDTRQKSGEER